MPRGGSLYFGSFHLSSSLVLSYSSSLLFWLLSSFVYLSLFVSPSVIRSFLFTGCLSFTRYHQLAPCSLSPQQSRIILPLSITSLLQVQESKYISSIYTRAIHCQSIYHLSNASNGIMSVIASSPDSAAVPYSPCQQTHNFYRDPSAAVQPPSPSSRTSSVSSFKSNYSVASTAPTTVYSPTSPTSSWRQCDSAASLDKILEPVFKRLPQEVYDNILSQLELLHTGSHQNGCLTCFQRDLHSLSLTSRVWEKAVRAKL